MSSPAGVAVVALVLLSILLAVLFLFGFVRFLRREEVQPFSWDLDYQRAPALFATWLRKPNRELWDGLWSSIGMSFFFLAAIPAALVFCLETAHSAGLFGAGPIPSVQSIGSFSVGIVISVFTYQWVTARETDRMFSAFRGAIRYCVGKVEAERVARGIDMHESYLHPTPAMQISDDDFSLLRLHGARMLRQFQISDERAVWSRPELVELTRFAEGTKFGGMAAWILALMWLLASLAAVFLGWLGVRWLVNLFAL